MIRVSGAAHWPVHERNPYPSDEDLDPLADMKIRGIYKPTGIVPGQSKDVMVEYIERKTLSEGPFEIGSEDRKSVV